MYFLTTGFPHWDGYGIYNDPEVSLLVSKGADVQQQPPTQPPTQGTTTNPKESPKETPVETPTEPPTEPPANPPVTPGAEIWLVYLSVGVVAAVAVVSLVLVRARRK
jgi:hypothetical protein